MRRRSSYNDYMSYYTATSEALAVDGYILRHPKQKSGRSVHPRIKTCQVRRKHKYSNNQKHTKSSAPKKRKKMVYVKEVSNVKFFSWRLIVTLFAIFFGMVATAASSAVLRKNHSELTTIRQEIIMKQDEEAMLRAKISEDYDMIQIERIATTRLNMSKPKAHQIVYIDLPKQDYVVHHGIMDYDNDPKGFWEVLSGLINSAKATLGHLY